MSSAVENTGNKAYLFGKVRAELQARIDRDELEMPLLPDVALNILSNPLNEDSDLRKLSKLIHRDQALAAYVLRVSNSAFYAPDGAQIISLQSAILRLGIFQLREIVTMVAFKSRLFDSPGYELMMQDLWRLAAASGAYAREVARLAGLDREIGFLCGLLHDLGKPVLLLAIVDILGGEKQKISDSEVFQLVEDFHVEVGAMIAEDLSFAGPLVETIKYHTQYENAPNFKMESCVVSLAGALARAALQASQLQEEQLRQLPEFATLGLTEEKVNELLGLRELIIGFVEGF